MDTTPAWRRPRALVAAAVLLAGLGGGGVWASGALSESCSGTPLAVTVAAQPEIAPALREIAHRFGTGRPRVAGRCVEVQVTAEGSAETARELGRGESGADAWVPESAIWFTVAKKAGADDAVIPPFSPPLAGSPVVLAATRPVGEELKAADVRPSWKLLLAARAGGVDLQRRMLDPAAHTTGTFAMIALDQVADPGDRLVADLRRTAPKSAGALLDDLTGLERFDRPLAVTSEQAVIAYNQSHRPNPAMVLTPREGTLMLDYPFAIVTQDPRRREAMEGFASALRARSSRVTLQRYGFRAPDGTINRADARRHGIDPAVPRPLKLPTQREIDRAFRSWR
ncbi:MAG TPA: substrate-binding domain-containing protein [Thermomonospora sp.]|nr:substrate-binding domain-containing protein [Thermomonospora sp.]